MSPLRTLSVLLLATGACASFAGIAWWGLTYWQVWTNDYLSLSQAGQCLVADSSICRLAAALCTGQHRALVVTYSPWLLWLGVSALFGAGPLTWVKAPRRVDHRPGS